MNLMEVVEQFGSETSCREVLAELRWPSGVTCPKCQSDQHSYDSKRYVWDCYSCGYQFSAIVGTIFQDTKLPLRKWFVATLLMVEAKKGISANQMKRTIGVSYKTAWYLCHRIRAAMSEAEAIFLSGIVEADETWIGGVQKGVGKGNWRKGKTMVMGVAERGGRIRLKVDRRRPTKHTVQTFLHSVVDPNIEKP